MSALSLHLTPSTVARRARKGWFARLINALQESRMRAAHEVIVQHRHLLPADFELAANRLDARTEDHLPFVRND